ncbi:hypothetical protein M0813_00743 [Anaeramoeba flamelloides]|uniref:SCP2 domain-containing protein n=1 Tax=Anaeramoeba flamelloides TaxID=1746091 RepID=A0ABQ8XPV0_9EUKA|nr:hypothetical protein M0813_00743 [Anaeramoeba flamelloides]
MFHFKEFLIELTISIKNNSASVEMGLEGKPDCVISCSKEVLMLLIDGSLDPSTGVMFGQLTVDNIEVAIQFSKSFDFDRNKFAKFIEKSKKQKSNKKMQRSLTNKESLDNNISKNEFENSTQKKSNRLLKFKEKFDENLDDDILTALMYVPESFIGSDKKGIFHWKLTGEKPLDITIKVTLDQSEILKGLIETPNCTITCSTDTLLSIIDGSLEASAALMFGQLIVDDLNEALTFAKAFKFDKNNFQVFKQKIQSGEDDDPNEMFSDLSLDLQIALMFVPESFIGSDKKGIFHWKLTGEKQLDITIKVTLDQSEILKGLIETPNCTITCSTDTLLSIIDGSLEASAALMFGQLMVDDLNEALTFAKAFSFDRNKFHLFKQNFEKEKQFKSKNFLKTSQSNNNINDDNDNNNANINKNKNQEEDEEKIQKESDLLNKAFSFLIWTWRCSIWEGVIQFVITDDEKFANMNLKITPFEIFYCQDNEFTEKEVMLTIKSTKILLIDFLTVDCDSTTFFQKDGKGSIEIIEDQSGDFFKFVKDFGLTKRNYQIYCEYQISNQVSEEERLEEAWLFLPLAYQKVDWDASIRYKITIPENEESNVLKTIIIDHQNSDQPVKIIDGFDDLIPNLTCTVILERLTFLSIIDGSLNPTKAFLKKKVEVDSVPGLLKFGKAFSFDRQKFKAFILNLRREKMDSKSKIEIKNRTLTMKDDIDLDIDESDEESEKKKDNVEIKNDEDDDDDDNDNDNVNRDDSESSEKEINTIPNFKETEKKIKKGEEKGEEKQKGGESEDEIGGEKQKRNGNGKEKKGEKVGNEKVTTTGKTKEEKNKDAKKKSKKIEPHKKIRNRNILFVDKDVSIEDYLFENIEKNNNHQDLNNNYFFELKEINNLFTKKNKGKLKK